MKEMTKRIFIVLLVMSGLVYDGQSQDTLTISQSELVQKVLENNLQSKIAKKQVEMARGDFRQSNSLFLPSVTASHTAMFTNNPLMAFGSKLNQEILTAADFDPALLNDPKRVNNYATEIQVLQPLLNLDGAFQRQAAKIQSEAFELQAARTGEYIELEANKAYMQLQLAYEAVVVLEKAKRTADEGLRLINNFYDQGLVQRADVLAVQVRQTEVENQLRYALSNIQNASDYLTVLLGEEAKGRVYKPESRISEAENVEVFNTELSSFRKDLVAMDKSVEGYEKMLKSNGMNSLPRINAFGNYQLYDDQLFGTNATGYLVGVRLSWNLFNGYKNIGRIHTAKAELEKAKIEKEKYRNGSQMELNKASRQLADARGKVTLTKQAQDHSAEAYRIRKDRFEEGLEKTTDVLASETQMFQKELE
ncbi:MAG: TolC family protein, partial [Cyclobacteriaceae bacterium]